MDLPQLLLLHRPINAAARAQEPAGRLPVHDRCQISPQIPILKRLVAGQRLADGLAGVRVPGFAGSEFENDGCVFGVCCARVAL